MAKDSKIYWFYTSDGYTDLKIQACFRGLSMTTLVQSIRDTPITPADIARECAALEAALREAVAIYERHKESSAST